MEVCGGYATSVYASLTSVWMVSTRAETSKCSWRPTGAESKGRREGRESGDGAGESTAPHSTAGVRRGGEGIRGEEKRRGREGRGGERRGSGAHALRRREVREGGAVCEDARAVCERTSM
eukprot:2151070-Rhodomonas_salina.1